MDVSKLNMYYCLNFRKDLIRTVTQAIYCTFALLIIKFMDKKYIIPTLDWLRQETHLQSQYKDISNNAEKQRSVYGNTRVLRSGVRLSIFIFLGITLCLLTCPQAGHKHGRGAPC